jgi:hypothetical protein
MTEPGPPPAYEEPPPAPEPEAEPPRRRVSGAAVLGVVLAALGVVWLLAAVDVFDADAELWLGILLVAVGAAVALLPAGVPRALLVVLGILLALAGAVVAAVDVGLSGGIGEERERPEEVGDLDDPYELGIGSLKLDLRDLDPGGRDRVDVAARVGIGELVVTVPDGWTVEVDAELGIGDIDFFGDHEDGTEVDLDDSRDGDVGEPTVALRLEGGIGSIKVTDDATE